MKLPKHYKGKQSANDDEYLAYMEKLANMKSQEWAVPPLRQLDQNQILTEMLNDNTYNYREFYESEPFLRNNALLFGGHFPDTYKTVYHPTFSNESKYSGKRSEYNPLGIEGGSWNGEEFHPSWGQYNNYYGSPWFDKQMQPVNTNTDIVDFYNDYNQRYLQQHQQNIDAVQKAMNVPIMIDVLDPGTGGEYKNVVNWVGPNAEFFNKQEPQSYIALPTAFNEHPQSVEERTDDNKQFTDAATIHELSHAVRNLGGGGNVYQTGSSDAGDAAYIDTGLNATERDLIRQSYPLEFDDFSAEAEGAATNTQLRYSLWKELRSQLKRNPSKTELDDYISKYDDQRLLNTLYNANGYGQSLKRKKLNIPMIKQTLKDVAML